MSAAERLVCTVAPVEAILRLAQHVPVFPCRRQPEQVIVRGESKLMGAKSPLTLRGLHDATQDANQIRAWWGRWPDALVGVPTGSRTRLLVVDYDTHKADIAAVDWIQRHATELLETKIHGTLNGGKHYLFRLPEGAEYRNGVCLTLEGVKRTGIDVRAEGGYIVWWPLHGGSVIGSEAIPLPAGLVDTQRIERVELPALSANAPAKWTADRAAVVGALAYLDPREYDIWSRVGMALHLASGGSDDGFSLWHVWSSGEVTGECPLNYSGINDCRYHWDSYRHDKPRKNTVTLGTIFELAKAKGFKMPRQELPPISDSDIGRMLVTKADANFDAEPEREVLDLATFTGESLLEAHRKRHAVYGTVPFDPNGDLIRLYPGGVTIWSGYPGAGKTTLLRQFVCHCLHRGSSAFLASLEEDPMDVLMGLASVAAGTRDPSSDQVQAFIDNYSNRFRLWGVIGIARHKRLLAVIRQLAEQGIRHAIIDSLMCIDVPNDDYEGQRQFANLLATTARASKIHIHLVAHPRKAVSSDQEPDLNDVAGAREIGGIADNVVFVRRAGKAEGSIPTNQTPMLISVRKQRHGTGWLGDVNGWFHRNLRQFNAEQFAPATRYLPDEFYENEKAIEWAARDA